MKPHRWLNYLNQISVDLENDDARLEHITRVILTLMGVTIFIFTPIVLIVLFSGPGPFDWYGLVILATLCLPVIAAWLLVHFGFWKLARHIPILIFLALGFFGVYEFNFGTTFLLFFVLTVLLAGIYYPKSLQLAILFLIITGSIGLSWIDAKDWDLTLTGGIPFSGLLIGIWLLQQLSNNLLHRSMQHQKQLTAKLQKEVDERKTAEQKMAEVNLTLEQRVRERTAQLEAANQELQTVSYTIAHDLRAPIRAIIGLNEMVIQEHSAALDQEILDHLEKTSSASSRMDSLIEGLLSLLSLGDTELSITVLDLSAMAEGIFSGLIEDLDSSTISFTAHPTPQAKGDPVLTIELLAQLISNAIKFAKPETPLQIEFGAIDSPEKPVYYLKDNGVGIHMDYAAHIFDPFISLNQPELFPGNGIGLTIARRIVRLHQGEIWVESEESQGSTFFFSL